MTVQAHLKWTDGLQFVARAGEGPAVILDSSDGASGAGPMQLVLMGVAGCTAIDIVMILKKKRVGMSRFEIDIAGEQAETYPKRYTKMTITYTLFGKGIKPKAVEQAIELSETKYCSAMASMNAEVVHSYRIVEEDDTER
jgi:putative redox protein